MKKILSLGVAAAVVSMTAVAASAAIEPIIVETEAVAGQTITVNINATDLELTDAGFVVTASDNLTLVDAVECDNGLFNEETGKFGWYDSEACAPGFTFHTLTYTVGEGEEASVSISSDDYADIINAEAAAVAVVAGGDDNTDIPGDDIIVDDPATDEPATDEPATDNPDTGIALAVVPAVLAGAAIVVSKKRK